MLKLRVPNEVWTYGTESGLVFDMTLRERQLLTGHNAADAADHSSEHVGIRLTLPGQQVAHQLDMYRVQLQFSSGAISWHDHLKTLSLLPPIMHYR